MRSRVVKDQHLDHRRCGATLPLGGELKQGLDLRGGADGLDFVLGARHGAIVRLAGNANVLPVQGSGKPRTGRPWPPACADPC